MLRKRDSRISAVSEIAVKLRTHFCASQGAPKRMPEIALGVTVVLHIAATIVLKELRALALLVDNRTKRFCVLNEGA